MLKHPRVTRSARDYWGESNFSWWKCRSGPSQPIPRKYEIDDEGSPNKYELPVVPEGYVMDEETKRDFLACNDRSDLNKF